MGGGPSSVFAAGLGAPRAEMGLRLGSLCCPGRGSCPAPRRWLELASAQRAGVAPRRAGHPGNGWVMPLARGGAGSDVSPHLLGLLGQDWGRWRQDKQQRQEALRREEVDALCSLLCSSTTPYFSFPLFFFFFFKEGGGRGRNPARPVDQTFHVLLTSPKFKLVLLTQSLVEHGIMRPWGFLAEGCLLSIKQDRLGYVTWGHSAVTDSENWDPGKKFSAFLPLNSRFVWKGC